MVPPQPAAFAGTGSSGTAGSTGATLATQSPYSDVASTGVHHDDIRVLAADGVFLGTDCGAGRFCPGEPLLRSTLAVWLVRVLEGTDSDPVAATRFADVSADHPHAAFIEGFAELEVTNGCGDGTRFCPDDTVTRAEMAVFLARAFNLPDGPDPGFSDVPPDAWYAPAVAKLAASGVTTGCGDGTRFCADDTVTRAEMASFLNRARTLPQHLEVNVFYCGPSGVYDEARLQTEVGRLQQHVDGFYRRQSGYDASGGTRGTTITFRFGGILPADILPPGHNWRDQTLSEWRSKSQAKSWSAGWKDPCNAAAEVRTGNLRSVILANMASGPDDTIGYAGQGTGPAISLTVANHQPPEKNLGYTRWQSFYYTVAHEIGHAFYDWKHPWEDDAIDQPPTPEQLMSVMSQPLRGAKLNLTPGEANSAYIACYHLAQHNWVELDADGQCQRPDSTALDEHGGPGNPDDEDSSELELRISWGSDASGRSDCPPNTSCRYLRYEYIGDWPQPPYQTECWSKGQRGFGPFNWLGDSSRGCIFWDDDETAQVVVNGIRSNEINFSDQSTPPTTTLPRTTLSTSYPEVTDCWRRGFEWDGYQLGQCTSYVAWRLRENGVGENDAYGGHYGFNNQWRATPCAAVDRARVARWGHARQWDDCAEKIGIRVDKSPAPGSVLVRNDTALDSLTGQFFGHLAYVEATNPDGSIVISDGNYNGRCGIRISQKVEKGTGPYQGDYRFIHFEEHAKRLAR